MNSETADPKVVPFSNGSDYAVYRDDNCDLCKYGFDEEARHYKCEYEAALDHAQWSDGLVYASYLKLLGLGELGDGKCTLFKSFDNTLRPGTVEYDKQRRKDLKALAKWSGKEVK